MQYFTDYQDEALAQPVRDGRRRELSQAARAFLDSKLRWDERMGAVHERMLA